MSLQLWGSVAVVIAASVIVGHALALVGLGSRRASPAVGLAALIVVAGIAIKLPGRAVTAFGVLALIVVVAVVRLVMSRQASRPPLGALVVLPLALLGASIPFIANGRIGLLGVSLDNDTATHLRWADALRNSAVASRYGLNPNYPYGPHSLIDAVSTGLGARLDLVLTALMVATVALTAMTATRAMSGEAVLKQVLVGLAASLLYLVAAYYAEGAFKEQIMSLLLLGLVLSLEEVRELWASRPTGWRAFLPVAILCAGGVWVYSEPALAWFGLTIIIWLGLEVVGRPRALGQHLRTAQAAVLPVVTGVLLILLALAPSASSLIAFASGVGISPAASGLVAGNNLGNLAGPLSPYEGLGIWNRGDFRFFPGNAFHAGELSALALGVVLFGIVWSVARRRYVMPSAVIACALIYWRASSTGQSPYLSAKALVIPGAVLAVIGLRALLSFDGAPRRRWTTVTQLAVAGVFFGFAAHSSYQVLRDESVWPTQSTDELLQLASRTQTGSVLFLGHSDFSAWLFADTNMSAIAPDSISLGQAVPRSNKPYVYGSAFDFDTVDPASLNRFRWFITTNTLSASQPPRGVRLVLRLPMYELWERVAMIPGRQVIEPPGAPGAVLNCRTRPGRALSRQRGIAAVMVAPIVIPVGGIPPSGVTHLVLRLPAGTWQLSLQYTSAEKLQLSVANRRFAVPAYLDRPGPVFAVGDIRSAGEPLPVAIAAADPSSIAGPDLFASIPNLMAVRLPATRTMVPLSRACGRYVDWYQQSTGTS